jgi:hypothetical protein
MKHEKKILEVLFAMKEAIKNPKEKEILEVEKHLSVLEEKILNN